jgi:hypothetical protein
VTLKLKLHSLDRTLPHAGNSTFAIGGVSPINRGRLCKFVALSGYSISVLMDSFGALKF